MCPTNFKLDDITGLSGGVNIIYGRAVYDQIQREGSKLDRKGRFHCPQCGRFAKRGRALCGLRRCLELENEHRAGYNLPPLGA